MTDYFIVHRDKEGNLVDVITDWFRLEYIRKENDFGSLYIDLPPIYSTSHFRIEDRLEIWRKIGALNPFLEMDTIWLIRLMRFKIDEQGKRFIHILAYDAVHLIERRIVAYNVDSDQAKKTLPADDMIKKIAYENLGAGCTDPKRDISRYLDIDPIHSSAPSMSMSFAHRKMLPLFQDICATSGTNGTYLTFDVIWDTVSLKFHLVTYVGQRGSNRTQGNPSSVIATYENGMLSYSSVTRDYTGNFNFIYAGGSGEKDNRIIATSRDDQSIDISPLNRYEDWIDASEQDGVDLVQTKSDQRLNDVKPKLVVNGHIQQVSNAIYGYHYFFGDLISYVMEDGTVMPIHLDTVHVTVDEERKDNVEIFSRNLDDTEY